MFKLNNCYLGGVIDATSATIKDYGSTYSNNVGINGGVYYLDMSTLYTDGTTFETNYAMEGSAIMLYTLSALYAQDTDFDGLIKSLFINIHILNSKLRNGFRRRWGRFSWNPLCGREVLV
jgi:hypothetical protein